MGDRRFTLSVAQIQTLALRTMGFRPDLEVQLRQPFDDSTEIHLDVYNVASVVKHDGGWEAWSIGANRDLETKLDSGLMPRFWKWREGGV